MDIISVKKTQELAKLKLEKRRFQKISDNLSEIISYIDILKKADTKNLQDTFNASGLKNVSIEDIPVKSDHLTQKEAIKNAKRSHNGFVQVERVI